MGGAIRAIASEFPDFKTSHPEIAWSEVIGMRTVLAHRYFDVDLNTLWEAVDKDLDNLQNSIDAILAREDEEQLE